MERCAAKVREKAAQVILLSSLFAATHVSAGCLTLISGPIVYDVEACKLIEPERVFDPERERFAWIGNLDAQSRKTFLDTYRGLYVKGKVVKSEAIAKGFVGEQNALTGETLFMYIPPSPTQCNQVLGKRLAANLKEVCCEGGGDAPCLLDTGYVLQSPKIVGQAGSAAGDESRVKAKKSKDYRDGLKAMSSKNYKAAVKSFEKARTNGELDIKGHYLLGFALRELDLCRGAISPLQTIHKKVLAKQIWADEEGDARKGVFLLARCYSKMNDPQNTVLILNSYLLEHQKYKTELKDSLNHKDFGWIHTSKEYKDYAKEARKKLGS